MRKIFCYLAAAFFVLSCEKEIPLDKEELERRIVVNGLFSAGDTMYIHLSESRDVLYEGDLPDITTASAGLYDSNDNLLGNFVHQSDGYYKLSDYLPVAGNTYRLKVINSGFDDVSGESEAPSVISVTSVDTMRKGNNMEYEIKFSDDPSQTNYYAVTINTFIISTDTVTGDVYDFENPFFSTKETFTQNGSADVDGSKWGTIFLFSDATFNGGACSFTAQNNIFGNTYLNQEDSIWVVVGLRSVSQDYYKYSISYANYQATSGDPFAQPVQVYSNIENGFGIFGGYSGYSQTLIIE